MQLPVLETERLLIRPLTPADLDDCHRLYLDIDWADLSAGEAAARAERQSWLEWTVRSYEQLARLYQPPYGERAVCRRENGRFLGLVGYVPCLNAFGQLPAWGGRAGSLNSTEMGLFWAVSPDFQGRGYATEAAQALIDHAFTHLRLNRIVATTEYDNLASQGVMRRLGMRLERNPYPEPPWLQVVGVLENNSDDYD